jgi:hypothetical protein
MFHHLAQAAALLLMLELGIIILLLLAISGGLAFGLYWARRKTGWVQGKLNTYVPMGVRYVHLGTDFAAKPFIMGRGLAARVSTISTTTQQLVRRDRARGQAAPEVASGAASAAPSGSPSPVP